MAGRLKTLSGMLPIMFLCACMHGQPTSHPEINTTEHEPNSNNTDTLKITTLNLAHGRKTAKNQLFVSKAKMRANLDDIANFLTDQKPDIIALQEADGASFWSGNFNHVEYLAENTNMKYFTHSAHVKGAGLSYGTAILSNLPIKNSVSYTFAPSTSTNPKGFIVTTLSGFRHGDINIASLHLDHKNPSFREDQAQQVIAKLKPLNAPLILAGDFNTQWGDREKTLKMLTQGLGLKAYQPNAKGLQTFPDQERRLDWILPSTHFQITHQKTHPEILSDQLAVTMEIK